MGHSTGSKIFNQATWLALTLSTACLLTEKSVANPIESGNYPIEESTIESIHTAIQEGVIDCEQLIESYLNRIKKYNFSLTRGAPLNAFVALNPNAVRQAKALDRRFQQNNELTGFLHCIPIAVKDNIDTVDTPSTSGSLALLGSQPVSNAFLVNQLRAAGGIIIGKAAMDEFASGGEGISGRSGRIGNAYDPNQNSGGSSGGSAVAVSANFAVLGIGTDNSGSVRVPAVFNGVYAIRPSTGLISHSGILPRGNRDGVAGVMARSIPDLAAGLAAIANSSDPDDDLTTSVPRKDSYAKHLKNASLDGKRIGVIRSVAGNAVFDTNDKPSVAVFNQVKARLKSQGASLVEIDLPLFDSNRANNMAGEAEEVNQYLSSFASTRKSYQDICSSGRTRLSEKTCFGHIESLAPKYSEQYAAALNTFEKNKNYLEGLMRKDNVDALLMPLSSWQPPSYYDDMYRTATTESPVASNSGLPAIALIAGWTPATPAMPIGFELIGFQYGEGDLIGLAQAYSSGLPGRPLPELKAGNGDFSFEEICVQGINNFITEAGWRSYQQFLKNGDGETIRPAAYQRFFKQQTQQFAQDNQQSVQACQ
ncbi:amidase [Synechococcus sp. UW179A]|uniref:amidase n=1 Tax=Synechococcus sp. UW179A TaxID=2575510 RepID=UPI000E0ED42C|nr:amidase [Synechococcus sp. UW179A]